MTRPVSIFHWAYYDTTYTITYNGVTHNVPNKALPVYGDNNWDFTVLGVGYKIPVPLQYYNTMLNSVWTWMSHLGARLSIYDVYKTTLNLTAAQVKDKLGANYTFLGSVIKSYGTVYYWKHI